MVLKKCRCGKLIPYGMTRCIDCQKKYKQQREEYYKSKEGKDKRNEYNRRYNKKRDPKEIAFYKSKAWRMLRDRYRRDKKYKCETPGCTRMGVEVHHKTPIQTVEGWYRRLDYDNLELLCTICHNNKPNHFKNSKKNNKKIEYKNAN